ncbi:MAG: chemotaxis protein CheB [Terriglobales bacterium]
MHAKSIVVVGGSAGALGVLQRIVRELPRDFPAPMFVVLHISPDAPGGLADILNRGSAVPAAFAKDQENIVPSRIYLAPPDHHLVISDGVVRLTRGPRENRTRPAIDPLFRSAARAYGKHVIAVLLSGLLDDGVQGLQVVSRSGGEVIVLKPEDAPFPQMPENAIKYDHPDHILCANEIPSMLQQLVNNLKEAPDMNVEHKSNGGNAEASGYMCPDCGGALFEVGAEPVPYFRCRVGHAYSMNALLAGHDDSLETALWAAVRSLEENADLKRRTAITMERSGSNAHAERLREDAQAQMEQAKLLRERIIDATNGSRGVGPTRSRQLPQRSNV